MFFWYNLICIKIIFFIHSAQCISRGAQLGPLSIRFFLVLHLILHVYFHLFLLLCKSCSMIFLSSTLLVKTHNKLCPFGVKLESNSSLVYQSLKYDDINFPLLGDGFWHTAGVASNAQATPREFKTGITINWVIRCRLTRWRLFQVNLIF